VIYLLDTNILIYLLKNNPPTVAAHINILAPDAQLRMSFFTYAELLKGAQRSSKRAEIMRKLVVLTRQIPVLYQSSASLCLHYAEQFNRLKSAGTPIGANDLWIASHALAEDAILVTNNTREFERVTGLTVENWV
jgi:tRNA(fMet)-specific endonuclease VapC